MLEHEESDESSEEENEQGNVGIDGIPVEEESLGIVKEDALHLDLVRVEEEHAEAEDCQKETDDSNCNFPPRVVAVETELHVKIRGGGDKDDDAESYQADSGGNGGNFGYQSGDDVGGGHP